MTPETESWLTQQQLSDLLDISLHKIRPVVKSLANLAEDHRRTTGEEGCYISEGTGEKVIFLAKEDPQDNRFMLVNSRSIPTLRRAFGIPIEN